MDDISEPVEPQSLRFLRRLVTVLTGVMIVGVLTVIVLLVIRLRASPPALALPAEITLPQGAAPIAFTQGPDWFAITTSDSILIYDADGTLRQTVAIER